MADPEPFTLSYHNTKRFIQLIRDRPCLWDRRSPEYKDRLTRDRAWAEICSEIDEAYTHGSAAERHEISLGITKKWYNIRDSYVKSLNPDLLGRRSRPYVHADSLRFLDDCYLEKINASYEKRNGKTRTDIEHVNTEDIEEDLEDVETEPWEHKVFVSLNEEEEPKTKKFKHSPEESFKENAKLRDEEDIISVLSNLIQKEEDEDRAFFKSITPSVKKLSDDSKLVFRIEVLQLIKKLKAKEKGKVKMKIERESIHESDSD